MLLFTSFGLVQSLMVTTFKESYSWSFTYSDYSEKMLFDISVGWYRLSKYTNVQSRKIKYWICCWKNACRKNLTIYLLQIKSVCQQWRNPCISFSYTMSSKFPISCFMYAGFSVRLTWTLGYCIKTYVFVFFFLKSSVFGIQFKRKGIYKLI